MGNTKSKKSQKEPDKFFEREKWKEQKRIEKSKIKANPLNKRVGVKDSPLPPSVVLGPQTPGPAPKPVPPPAHIRSYDDEALDRMRYQLHNDADAFLLNNILLSVQFFENYERETHSIKNNPISERENLINDAMIRRNKHVFFADRLQESIHEHVSYQRNRGQTEPLCAPRLFVIYDNVEASEPGDTSDYSAVLDAPFYKLQIEDCKEPGYVKLKKIEVLESTLHKEVDPNDAKKINSDDSVYTDSEKESIESDDTTYVTKGEDLLQQIKSKMIKSDGLENNESANGTSNARILNLNSTDFVGRRFSGPIKQVSLQVVKSDLSNLDNIRNSSLQVPEENDVGDHCNDVKDKKEHEEGKPRKSILKVTRRMSGAPKDLKSKTSKPDRRSGFQDNNLGDDTETSGYRSNSSSRHNESSETESDYGYSTITEAATPKKVELSLRSDYALTSGALPDESWTSIDVRSVENWSDDEDDEINDSVSKESLSRNLYERFYFLNSFRFMNNFIDNFILNLGSGLGLSQDAINGAMTQGASIYCNSTKNGSKTGFEIFPALIAAWPNAANQWIIRERKIIQNPRTNFSYQWPTKYMVSKAIGFGCLLVPVGFRSKRGVNPEQTLQWKITFPAAERYLESCLAHSHIRCYLFTLALHKTFMENETSKIGIDASHIKNHLFWQCEDNYAKWPEDRLGETLRLFLRSFYVQFGQSRFPNYFVESCNEFKSIPKPVLLKLQRKLADILEAPVMHMLHTIDKLKYNKREFYPSFNCHKLYEILTCKNPLRILNPNLPTTVNNYVESSDSEDDVNTNFWDQAKSQDKHYQWKKERQRQIQERRKAHLYNKKQKSSGAQEKEINRSIMLPAKLETERRRLVLEFFIPHFIAMARSSEKFDAIKQAVIYLEQAQRLCVLLLDEAGGDMTANEYLDVIRDKLADCQRKLVKQGGYKLPLRKESHIDRIHNTRRRPKVEHIVNQNSPTEVHSIQPFTFVDIHVENHEHQMKLNGSITGEESKL